MTLPPLWQHQRRAIDFAQHRAGTMLAIRLGGGKTRTTIELLERWGASRVLILSPLSVVSTWPREIERYAARTWTTLPLPTGTCAQRTARAEAALRVFHPLAVIINHESAWRMPFRKLALSTLWDVVVVDELHRGKAPGGRFSMFLAELRKHQPFAKRLGLTGTPMPHSALDLYGQLRFIDPTVYGTSNTRFKARYAIYGGFENRQVIGFRDTADMMARFHSAAFVAQEKDLLDLPEEVDTEITVELEPAARKIYAELESEFYAQVEAGEITASNALVKLLRLQQICSGTVKLDSGEEKIVSEAKLDALTELLMDVEPGRKMVVFGRFRCDLETARAAAEIHHLRYGEVSGSRKDLDAGRYPDDVDLLGVQVQAGGVGIDLSKASLAFYLSTGFSLGDYTQTRARLHRPGQKHPVTFVHLLAGNTIDWRIYRALAKRQDVIAQLLKKEPTDG
jgi:SNF2 family DNA or RNA helicase